MALLALQARSRERPMVQPTSSLGDKPDPWVAIDDSREAAAAPGGGLLDRDERKAG